MGGSCGFHGLATMWRALAAEKRRVCAAFRAPEKQPPAHRRWGTVGSRAACPRGLLVTGFMWGQPSRLPAELHALMLAAPGPERRETNVQQAGKSDRE